MDAHQAAGAPAVVDAPQAAPAVVDAPAVVYDPAVVDGLNASKKCCTSRAYNAAKM